MSDAVLRGYVWQRTARATVWGRLTLDERGEGVISTAIAVLVMAFLGALMYAGFKLTFGHVQSGVDNQVGNIN